MGSSDCDKDVKCLRFESPECHFPNCAYLWLSGLGHLESQNAERGTLLTRSQRCQETGREESHAAWNQASASLLARMLTCLLSLLCIPTLILSCYHME